MCYALCGCRLVSREMKNVIIFGWIVWFSAIVRHMIFFSDNKHNQVNCGQGLLGVYYTSDTMPELLGN